MNIYQVKNPNNLSYVTVFLFLFILFKIQNLEKLTPAEVTNDNSKLAKGTLQSSMLQDMSDPFQTFPRVVPHACVNVTQRWKFVCEKLF